MSTLFLSLAAAGFVLAFTVLYQMNAKRIAQAKLRNLVLRPNCLLTRYPIAFVSGKKSLFRLYDHWNEIPMFLREHGYEVLVVDPGYSKNKPSSESVVEALKSLNEKCHVIADSSLKNEIEAVAQEVKSEFLVSLTLVRNPNVRVEARPEKIERHHLKPLGQAVEIFELGAINELKPSPVTKTFLAAHNLVLLGKQTAVDAIETGAAGLDFRFLDLAVSLAERDASGCYLGSD